MIIPTAIEFVVLRTIEIEMINIFFEIVFGNQVNENDCNNCKLLS